jgi:hypothetical protein
MSIFDVTLTPADLPQPPTPAPIGATTGSGSTMDFYPPGGAHATPQASDHATEVAPVFGGGGMG